MDSQADVNWLQQHKLHFLVQPNYQVLEAGRYLHCLQRPRWRLLSRTEGVADGSSEGRSVASVDGVDGVVASSSMLDLGFTSRRKKAFDVICRIELAACLTIGWSLNPPFDRTAEKTC